MTDAEAGPDPDTDDDDDPDTDDPDPTDTLPLNDLDRFILDFLTDHEWAAPQLIRAFYNDERRARGDDPVTGSYVSHRMARLREHDHLERAHPDAPTNRLLSDPRHDT